MSDIVKTEVNSITTKGIQTLFLSGDDAKYLKGKRVLIVDDVISTGESLHSVENLINQVGGIVVGRFAVLAEGDAQQRDDIKYLAPLPLFAKDGTPIK